MTVKLIRKTTLIITIIVIIIMIIPGLFSCKSLGNISDILDTFTVTRGDIVETISTSGYVESSQQNDYSLPLSGKVLKTLAAGDTFSQGDILIEIDTTRQKLLIQQAEENLNLAENSLALAKISYQQALDANHVALQMAQDNTRLSEQSAQNALTALEDANEYLSLAQESTLATDLQISAAKSQSHSAEGAYNQALISQSSTYWSNISSTESAASQIQSAAKNIEQAEIQLKLSQINLELAKMDTDDSTILAPYNGIVLSSNYEKGQYASPGVPAISIINSDFVIKADINEVDVINLEVGQDVDITLDAYYENNFKGEITEISPISTNIGGVVSFGLTVKPETENAPKLLYGLSASLDITLSGAENVLYAPVQSVVEEDGKSYVDLVAEDGTIVRTEVTTGIFNYDYIEIKSGLSEGDKILVTPTADNSTNSLSLEVD